GKTSWGAVGARAFDAHNRGRLDLYVVDMHSDMWMGTDWDHRSLPLALEYEKKKFSSSNGPFVSQDPEQIAREKDFGREVGDRGEDVGYGKTFYRNEGGGKFTEISDGADLETFWPWSIATGDFDNDGWEDVFIASGMGYPYYYWPNYLMMNQGDGTFRN